MYGWIWRRLPGNLAVRTFAALVLTGLVVAVLWYVVFPWLEPRIPLDPATVDG
ncbi:hypothetical protein FHS43_000056 [Streptosporangium becharense]|uniref:ABC transporter permease n=1 Tax=Streptosporangium becharense TaxID=1816182 RepID=A0A7W9IG83_9ACTN|nr:hypothetical protein [Streptosporangium becharense]MBB2908810.1 hypothetical protein [Streptosporangium becharense]MBB5820172.1 hypothetical protein [Streptosporangium becharense]